MLLGSSVFFDGAPFSHQALSPGGHYSHCSSDRRKAGLLPLFCCGSTPRGQWARPLPAPQAQLRHHTERSGCAHQWPSR